MPKFTVVLPTHDHADTLFWSVASVQAQSRQDFELLIVGDGVPDRTREIVAALQRQDPRIRYLDNAKGPRNGELHRHQALRKANGNLICYLSDDDLWLPDHLETLETLLADHDLAHTMQIIVDPGQSTPQTFFFNVGIPAQVEAMRRNETGFSTAAAGHTAAAYRRLPFGWRTTPPEHNVDLYMWLQFLDQLWCQAASLARPTVVRFPAPYRRGWTATERSAELARWSGRLTSPSGRTDLIRAALEPLCARTHMEQLRAVDRTILLKEALETFRGQAPAQERAIGGPAAYRPNTTLRFHAGSVGSRYLASGFCQPEPWGVWSDESSAVVVLPLERPLVGPAQLILHHTAVLARKRHESMRIALTVNDRAVDSWEVTVAKRHPRRRVSIPVECLKDASRVILRFQVEHPVRPVDIGKNGDRRLLGLGLLSMSLNAA